MTEARVRPAAGWLLTGAWLLALVLPAAGACRPDGVAQVLPGWYFLGLGWLALFWGVVGWIANPLLGAAIVLLLRRRAVPGWVALPIPLVALLALVQPVALGVGEMDLRLCRLDAGYWLWLAAACGPALLFGWERWRARASG